MRGFEVKDRVKSAVTSPDVTMKTGRTIPSTAWRRIEVE